MYKFYHEYKKDNGEITTTIKETNNQNINLQELTELYIDFISGCGFSKECISDIFEACI